MSEEEISFQKKIFFVKGRNSVSEEKSNVTGRNFLLQDSTSLYKVNIYSKSTEDSDATKMREFGLKFPVNPVRC